MILPILYDDDFFKYILSEYFQGGDIFVFLTVVLNVGIVGGFVDN